jgi:hypothetical protein
MMKLRGLVGTMLGVTTSLALPTPSHADVRVGIGVQLGGRDHYRGGYRDTFRFGYDRGFEDGYKHGGKDSHHDKDYNFRHDKRYRNGDSGYKGWMGSRWEYANGYRRGYEEGYRRSYERFDRYDRDHRGGGYGYGRYDDRDRYRHRHAGSDEWCYERHAQRRW